MEEKNRLGQLVNVGVTLVILAGAISGTGVYLYQKNKTSRDLSILKSKITTLENENNTLKNQISSQTTPTTSNTPSSATTTATDQTVDKVTNETSNWQIYKNSLFSFRYPNDWQIFNPGEGGVQTIRPKNSLDDKEGLGIARGPIDIPGNEPTPSIVDINGTQAEKKIFKDGEENTIEIKPLDKKNQYKPDNNTYFLYWFIYTEGPTMRYSSTVVKILSTLEFSQ